MALSRGHLSTSPKHPLCTSALRCLCTGTVSLWQHIVRHGGVCPYSALIHACLCAAASDGLSPSLPPPFPLAFQKGSCVWFWRGALVPSVCCRATRPKHMVGMQGARQSAQKQCIVNKLLSVVTFHSQADYKPLKWHVTVYKVILLSTISLHYNQCCINYWDHLHKLK